VWARPGNRNQSEFEIKSGLTTGFHSQGQRSARARKCGTAGAELCTRVFFNGSVPLGRIELTMQGPQGRGRIHRRAVRLRLGRTEAKRKGGPIRVVTAHVVSPPFFLFIFSLFI
jgi:hypothetical protein